MLSVCFFFLLSHPLLLFSNHFLSVCTSLANSLRWKLTLAWCHKHSISAAVMSINILMSEGSSDCTDLQHGVIEPAALEATPQGIQQKKLLSRGFDTDHGYHASMRVRERASER
jgi:hypothetical protein